MNIKEDTLTAIHAYFMQMESQVRIKVLVAFYGGNAVYGLPEDERLRCVYYVYHGSYHPQEEIDGIEYKGYHVSAFLTSLPQGHYYRIAHMPVVYVGDADFCKQLTALLPKCFKESAYLNANWSKRYNFNTLWWKVLLITMRLKAKFMRY